MPVLLANRRLALRRRGSGGPDGHGDRPVAAWGTRVGPWPGRAAEKADAPAMGATGGRTWVLALDPAAWPVLQGDLVVCADSAQEWLVVTADLLTNNADSAVDYIRVEAHAHLPAGTRP